MRHWACQTVSLSAGRPVVPQAWRAQTAAAAEYQCCCSREQRCITEGSGQSKGAYGSCLQHPQGIGMLCVFSHGTLMCMWASLLTSSRHLHCSLPHSCPVLLPHPCHNVPCILWVSSMTNPHAHGFCCRRQPSCLSCFKALRVLLPAGTCQRLLVCWPQ